MIRAAARARLGAKLAALREECSGLPETACEAVLDAAVIDAAIVGVRAVKNAGRRVRQVTAAAGLLRAALEGVL